MNAANERILVGIGDFAVTRNPQAVVRTLALGSCIAIVLLDPQTRSVGMVHIALPESQLDLERAQRQPAYFADSGLQVLLQALGEIAAPLNPRRLMVKIAGGAQVSDPNSHFNIGKRNALAVKRLLWQQGMAVLAEDLGGSISRSVSVHCATGRVIVSTPGVADRCI